jgi:MFS family permease
MIWGLFPILLATLHYDNQNIGIITAIYPAVWGIGQLFTGKMSDHYSKKAMLFWGMLLQGLAILCIPYSSSFFALAFLSATLGLGTALVYPTFLSTIAQATNPKQRAESIGTFRLWRDLGYAFGAVISGVTADLFGVEYAILLIGGLTIISSVIIKYRMPEQLKIAKDCIDVEEVRQAILENIKITIIDVRNREEYEQAHIPDAVNIELGNLKDSISQLDKDVLFVTVCGKGGGRSADGASILKEAGLNAIWLCGGTTKWLAA